MKRIFSGVKPSGELTIGNYLGAIRNFATVQREADCFFCVVDLHALTVPQDPALLRRRSYDVARLYIACGIDPQASTVFVQSHVPAHSELGWLMGCLTYFGELSRMTQFKEKSDGKANVTSGLFTYPVLMVADILLYDADLVPVGEDQKQHLELTRDIAERFNNRFGKTFTVPEAFIPSRSSGGRIMSLQNPTKKMSKSEDDPQGSIELLDDASAIRKKVMSAVTDSGREVVYDEVEKPAISNLMVIYSLCSGESLDQIADRFNGAGYGAFKKALVDVLVATLEPVQSRYRELCAPGLIEQTLEAGRMKAEPIARGVLARVQDAMGLAPRQA